MTLTELHELFDFLRALPRAAREIRAGNAAKGFGRLPDLSVLDQPHGTDNPRPELETLGDELYTWMSDRLDATAIGLIHGEVSEMMEARRRPGWETDPSEHVPEFTAFVEEGADVIIRVLDLYERLGLSNELAGAIGAKVAFNRTRPFKHGRTF